VGESLIDGTNHTAQEPVETATNRRSKPFDMLRCARSVGRLSEQHDRTDNTVRIPATGRPKVEREGYAVQNPSNGSGRRHGNASMPNKVVGAGYASNLSTATKPIIKNTGTILRYRRMLWYSVFRVIHGFMVSPFVGTIKVNSLFTAKLLNC